MRFKNLFGFFGALGEFLNPSARVYMFYGAGIKGMAITANFHADFRHGSAAGPGIAAGALHYGLREVLWVDF